MWKIQIIAREKLLSSFLNLFLFLSNLEEMCIIKISDCINLLNICTISF